MKELDKNKVIIDISLKDYEELRRIYDNYKMEVQEKVGKEVETIMKGGLIVGVTRVMRIKPENKSFNTYELANSNDLLYSGYPIFITVDKLKDIVGDNIEYLKSKTRELIDTNTRYESNWFVKLFLKRK